MKKVWIEEGCIGCGLCSDTCFEAFTMLEDKAIVREGVNYNDFEALIKEAADNCPVAVIKYE